MVALLVKKQLSEIFRGWFYDAKRSRLRSRAATAAFIALYAVLLLGLFGGMFTTLALGICAPLCAAGLDWLYFTLFSLAGLVMGVFGSVFHTFSGLYQAKDNDLLLSLPIPVRAILLSRLLGVYLTALLYSAVCLLPCVVVYWAVGVLSAASVLGGLLLVLTVSLLVTVLSCLLGWAVAKLSHKLRHKSFITVLLALAGFALYYLLCFRANELLSSLLLHPDEVGAALRQGGYPLYLLGRMGQGDLSVAVAVFAVTLVLCAAVWALLERTFLRIATTDSGSRAVYRERPVRVRGVSSALLHRELGRFTASPNYMLNCGFATVLLPVLGAVLLIKRGELLPTVEELLGADASALLSVLLCAALCLVASLNDMTASAVSLEGKNLWLAQSLPVTPWQILHAKLSVQVLITSPPLLFASLCAILTVRPAPLTAVLLAVLPQVFAWLSASFGLLLDLRRPDLHWTSELTVIKQRPTVGLALLCGWVYALAIVGLSLPLVPRLGAAGYLAAWTVLTAALTAALLHRLKHRGGRIYAEL